MGGGGGLDEELGGGGVRMLWTLYVCQYVIYMSLFVCWHS